MRPVAKCILKKRFGLWSTNTSNILLFIYKLYLPKPCISPNLKVGTQSKISILLCITITNYKRRYTVSAKKFNEILNEKTKTTIMFMFEKLVIDIKKKKKMGPPNKFCLLRDKNFGVYKVEVLRFQPPIMKLIFGSLLSMERQLGCSIVLSPKGR